MLASMAWTMCRLFMWGDFHGVLVPVYDTRSCIHLNSNVCMHMHIFSHTGQGHVNQLAEVQIVVCCACHKSEGVQ